MLERSIVCMVKDRRGKKLIKIIFNFWRKNFSELIACAPSFSGLSYYIEARNASRLTLREPVHVR